MEISYITAPIIGAVIGYSTNWIAIKMMFRPRKAINIGKLKLPFTPGIIPKNRKNIAIAISSTITNSLLTTEDLKNVLLSKKVEDRIIEYINLKISEDKEKTINEILEENIQKQNLNKICDYILDKGTKKILHILKEENISNIISEQIKKAIEDRINGTILSIIGGKKIIENISKNIEENIDEYIDIESEKIIYEILQNEINNILEKQVKDINTDINYNQMIISIYEKIIINKSEKFISLIDIKEIIENKINSMEMEELEKIILRIMKKELNAVINLGAVIGLILGLLNIIN